jgi:hypothetical protein
MVNSGGSKLIEAGLPGIVQNVAVSDTTAADRRDKVGYTAL